MYIHVSSFSLSSKEVLWNHISLLPPHHGHPQKTYICEATLVSGKKSLLFV